VYSKVDKKPRFFNGYDESFHTGFQSTSHTAELVAYVNESFDEYISPAFTPETKRSKHPITFLERFPKLRLCSGVRSNISESISSLL